jgi:hypothetical protein
MSITAKSSATIIPFSAVTKGNFEKSKDLWLIQVFADKSLTNGTKNVAAMIGLHMNRGQHGLAYPGFGLLAKLTGLCRRTIIRAVKALERAGHVVITRSRRGSKNNPNEYQPVLKAPVQNVTTLVSPVSPPSDTDVTTPSDMGVTRTSEDNLRENLLDNLYPNRGAVGTAPRRDTQIKGVGEEVRQTTPT